MTERIISDPAAGGWIYEDGKWLWDGQSAGSIEDGDTEGQITTWSGGAWTPEGAVVVSGGNVGVGTGDITETLDVKGSFGVNQASGIFWKNVDRDTTNGRLFWNDTVSAFRLASAGAIDFRSGGFGDTNTRLAIDATGNVGIGMSPLRSTAKEQLAEWKSRFDARLKAEPKADKKAVTLEITDDAFEVLPTEEALSEWMETRAAGDKLQVDGNISASGKVLATNVGSASNSCGIRFSAASEGGASTRLLPTDTTSVADGEVDLGSASGRFKNAFFSGTVTCGGGQRFQVGDEKTYLAKGSIGSGSGTALGSNNGFLLLNNSFDRLMPSVTAKCDLGSATQQVKAGHFSGTVDAAGFTVNGSPIGGGNSVDKDTTTAQTMKSTLQAPDFIASSDERLEDNITTAPVGLIDSLKGREWDWKESGEKGSGVIAQELEEVLPHLVHEDDEGMKSVSYNGLVAYLIEEVKALRAEVEGLKS